MKKTLIAFILLLSTAICSQAAENGVYINGYDKSTKPFAYLENGVVQGFDIECLEWIAKDAGIKVRHEPIIWSQGPDLIRSGKIDMIYSSMTITVPRLMKIRFSNPYWDAGQAAFAKNSSSADFAQVTRGQVNGIGAMRGSTGAEWVQHEVIIKNSLSPDLLHPYQNYEHVVNAVASGEVEVGIIDSPIVRLSIGSNPMKVLGVAETGEQYGVAMRKNDIKLHRIINTGLYRLMKSPDWERLKTKYNLN